MTYTPFGFIGNNSLIGPRGFPGKGVDSIVLTDPNNDGNLILTFNMSDETSIVIPYSFIVDSLIVQDMNVSGVFSAISIKVNNTLTYVFPQTATNNYILSTNSTGVLSWIANSTNLSSLNDTLINTPVNNNILIYNGVKWVNSSLNINQIPDISSIYLTVSAFNLKTLSDISNILITTPLNKQVLYYDNITSKWKNSSLSLLLTISDIPDLSSIYSTIAVSDAKYLIKQTNVIFTKADGNFNDGVSTIWSAPINSTSTPTFSLKNLTTSQFNFDFSGGNSSSNKIGFVLKNQTIMVLNGNSASSSLTMSLTASIYPTQNRIFYLGNITNRFLDAYMTQCNCTNIAVKADTDTVACVYIKNALNVNQLIFETNAVNTDSFLTTTGRIICNKLESILIKLNNIDYIFPVTNGDNAQYLQTDGNGTLSWNTINNNLSTLSDCSIITPTNAQYLIYNSTLSKWENATVTAASSSLLTLTDTNITGLFNNQILKYHLPTNKWINSSDLTINNLIINALIANSTTVDIGTLLNPFYNIYGQRLSISTNIISISGFNYSFPQNNTTTPTFLKNNGSVTNDKDLVWHTLVETDIPSIANIYAVKNNTILTGTMTTNNIISATDNTHDIGSNAVKYKDIYCNTITTAQIKGSISIENNLTLESNQHSRIRFSSTAEMNGYIYTTFGVTVPTQFYGLQLAYNAFHDGTIYQITDPLQGTSRMILSSTEINFYLGAVNVAPTTSMLRISSIGVVLGGSIFGPGLDIGDISLPFNNIYATNIYGTGLSIAEATFTTSLITPLISGNTSISGNLDMLGNIVLTTGYRRIEMRGGNTIGYMYGSFTNLGDGIHLGYNAYNTTADGWVIYNVGGATSRLSLKLGEIEFYVDGENTPPTTLALKINTTGIYFGKNLYSTGGAKDLGSIGTPFNNLYAAGANFTGGISVLSLQHSSGTITINSSITPSGYGSHGCGSLLNPWSYIYSVGGSISLSSRRYKKDISSLDKNCACNFILALNPCKYNWIDETHQITNKLSYGLIVEQVYEVMKDTDFKDFSGVILDNDNEPRALNYSAFISPMLSTIQCLHHELDEAKKEINLLKSSMLLIKEMLNIN
jgi:hypothetical protein